MVHQVPGVLSLHTLSFSLHFSFAVLDDVKEFPISVCPFRVEGSRKSGILDFIFWPSRLHPLVVSMANGTLVTVDLFGPAHGFGACFDRVGLVDGLPEGFWTRSERDLRYPKSFRASGGKTR
jgi:hypothetical protein